MADHAPVISLRLIKAPPANLYGHAHMATFVFKCPNTSLNVQGFVADDPLKENGNVYESITCLACRQTHLVNPTTGKVLTTDEK
ncbi:MAG TPA: hypothetical protein VMH84_10490 [Xanthobacteraceae bacterium]|nr:hypothetical protein [Xanthobacteraceae bacterium]